MIQLLQFYISENGCQKMHIKPQVACGGKGQRCAGYCPWFWTIAFPNGGHLYPSPTSPGPMGVSVFLSLRWMGKKDKLFTASEKITETCIKYIGYSTSIWSFSHFFFLSTKPSSKMSLCHPKKWVSLPQVHKWSRGPRLPESWSVGFPPSSPYYTLLSY